MQSPCGRRYPLRTDLARSRSCCAPSIVPHPQPNPTVASPPTLAAARPEQLSQDELKKQAAWKAVDYVKSGMVVGLGTGSTAAFAVERLGQLLKEGKLTNIVGVPTSIRTYEQAKSLGIPLATLDEQPKLDVAIDGADEVCVCVCGCVGWGRGCLSALGGIVGVRGCVVARTCRTL